MGVKVSTWAKAQKVGGPTKKVILLVLADRASDVDWSTFAGQQTIARDAEVTVRTVQRVLGEFESMELIRREERRRPDGYRTSDLIYLNPDWGGSISGAAVSGDPESGEPMSDDTESGDQMSPSGDQDVRAEPDPTESQATESHVTSETTSGDIHDGSQATRCRGNNPKLEPSVEPSSSSSNSRMSARDAGEEEEDHRSPPPAAPPDRPPEIAHSVRAALAILAEGDLDRRLAKAHLEPVSDGESWRRAALKRRREQHLDQLTQRAREQPELDPEQLAASIDRPAASLTSETQPGPADSSVAAQWQQAHRNDQGRRTRCEPDRNLDLNLSGIGQARRSRLQAINSPTTSGWASRNLGGRR